MGHSIDITHRHGRDRVRDLCFIATALLITALAIGAPTSQAVDRPIAHPMTHFEVR